MEVDMSWNELLGWSFWLVGVFKTFEETYDLPSWVFIQWFLNCGKISSTSDGSQAHEQLFCVNEVNWTNDFGYTKAVAENQRKSGFCCSQHETLECSAL